MTHFNCLATRPYQLQMDIAQYYTKSQNVAGSYIYPLFDSQQNVPSWYG